FVTGAPVSILPPSERKYDASALLARCDPPRAKGQPPAWALAASTSPNAALPSHSSGTIECAASPENSARARCPRNQPSASPRAVEQTSWTTPGNVSAADRHDPPTVSAPSRTSTDCPARASSIAAHSPLGPEPMTMASYRTMRGGFCQ